MGTFAAGHMLDPYTGRPIAAQVLKVLAYPTDLPVTPDGGPIATGARGGYGQFTVPGLDAVSLVASDGTTVGPLASVEAQVAAGNAGPFLESAEDRLTVLESRSGTSVAGIVDTFANLPSPVGRDGQAWIVQDQIAMYVSNGTPDWQGPIPVQGAATDAAMAVHVADPDSATSTAARRKVYPGGGAAGPDAVNIVQGHEQNAVATDLHATLIGGGGQAGFNNVIGGDGANVGTPTPNTIQPGTNAHYSAIPGGYDNSAGGLASLIEGFHCKTEIGTTHGTISGGSYNTIAKAAGTNDYSTIGGGSQNVISATAGTIAGGMRNTVNLLGGTIGGGTDNQASGDTSTVAGGMQNHASSTVAAIGGGRGNQAAAPYSTIAGGRDNATGGSGYAAIAGGQNNSATGAHTTIVGGLRNTVTIDSATVVGGMDNTASGTSSNVAGGRDNTASGPYSSASGRSALAYTEGQAAQASGQFAAKGDAQTSVLVLRVQTTNATEATCSVNGAGLSLQMQHDSSAMFTIQLLARDTATGDSKAWRIEGLATNDTGAAVTFIGTPTTTVIGEDPAATTWAASMLGLTDSLNLRVTGEAGKTIRWVARMELTEVVG